MWMFIKIGIELNLFNQLFPILESSYLQQPYSLHYMLAGAYSEIFLGKGGGMLGVGFFFLKNPSKLKQFPKREDPHAPACWMVFFRPEKHAEIKILNTRVK